MCSWCRMKQVTVRHLVRQSLVCITFAASALTALHLWCRASYQLSRSIKNIDLENPGLHSRRLFKTIFAITFGMSLLLMLGALIVLIVFPSVRTPTGFGIALTLMAWCSIVRFGAMNVLAHHLMPESRPTIKDLKPTVSEFAD